jgi:hypothetical protein
MVNKFNSIVGCNTKVKTTNPLSPINFIDNPKLFNIAKKIHNKLSIKEKGNVINNTLDLKYPRSLYEHYVFSWSRWSIKNDNNLLL